MTGQEQYLLATPPPTDWIYFVVVLVGMILFVGIGEFVRKRFNWSPESTRKLVHIGVGVLASFTPRIFATALPALLLGLIFTVVNFLTLRLQLLKGMHGTERVSYGTILFPIAYLILVLLFWTREPAILIMSMLVLAFGDSAAAIVGETNKSATVYHLTSDKKSVEGSFAMFVVSFVTLFTGIHHFGIKLNLQLDYAAGLAFSGALTATAWEALSSRGLDNLTVPLSVAFVLSCYIFPSFIDHEQLSLGVVFGIIIAVGSYYAHVLARSGAVATFLLASLLYGIGGLKWTVPIFVFFIFSSVLSKIGKARKASLESVFEKSDERDYAQVAANGGVAGILVVLSYLFPHHDFYPMYLGSVAAVTADTWGTEIGLLTKAEPVLVTTFKRVKRGSNGGVTLLGVAAGLVGAAVIALVARCWILDWRLGIGVVAAGFLGSLVDSLLGATVQAQYRCEVCQTLTERRIHHDNPTTLVRGYRWMNNDAVNWICAAAGAATMWILVKW